MRAVLICEVILALVSERAACLITSNFFTVHIGATSVNERIVPYAVLTGILGSVVALILIADRVYTVRGLSAAPFDRCLCELVKVLIDPEYVRHSIALATIHDLFECGRAVCLLNTAVICRRSIIRAGVVAVGKYVVIISVH